MKTYCYHCGKELLSIDKSGLRNIHIKCAVERDKIIFGIRKERMKMLMQDPEIRKRIEKIDIEIIKKIKEKNE